MVRVLRLEHYHCVVVLNSTSCTRGKWCFLVSADLAIVCDCFSHYEWYASMFEMSDNPSTTCGLQLPYKDVVITVLGFFINFFVMFIFYRVNKRHNGEIEVKSW